jgi:tetratricopeptide (TPR) repeat protein
MTDSTGQIDIKAAIMTAGIITEGKKDFDSAIVLYEELLDRVEDSTATAALLFRLGSVYYFKKDFEKALEYFNLIKDDYLTYFAQNANPQKYIALTFQAMDEWPRAENEFRWLIDNYQTTEAAFDAYLIIAEHYQDENNQPLVKSWYGRAEKFYLTMAGKYQKTNIEASAISYVAEIARLQKDWPKAAELLESLFYKFPGTEIGRRSASTAAAIYRNRLGNTEKSDNLINRLKAELLPHEVGKNIDAVTDDNI